MLALITYILVNIGLTLIITKSKLFKKLREYLKLKNPDFFGYWIQCPQCFGFFSGLLTSIIWYSPTYIINPINILCPILDGFISSCCSYIIYLSIIPLIKKYD